MIELAKSEAEEHKPVLAVCGDTGLKEYGGYIQEEFDSKLAGDAWLRKSREMGDNEGSIASSHWAIEAMVRGTKRTWIANESGHPRASEAQEFVAGAWEDMESTTQTILGEAFGAIQPGWSYMEILYKLRKGNQEEPRLRSEFNDGAFGWRDFSPRAQESREKWEFDSEGRLLGMWQRMERTLPNKYGTVFIPVDRACHFRFRSKKDNPEGYSFYRPSWPSYYYAQKLREIEGISLERNGAGLVVIELPPDIMDINATDDQVSTRNAYQELGRKLRVSSIGHVVMPAKTDHRGNNTGYNISLLSSSGKNNLEFDPVIKRYQSEMLKTFHTQFLDFGVNQEGSHAIHSSATSMLGFGIAAINKAIDEEINRSAVSGLMRLNGFPVEAWPYLQSGDVEKQTLADTATFLSSLISSGAMEPGKDISDYARMQLGLEAKEGPSLDDMIGAVGMAPEVTTETEEAEEPTQLMLPIESESEPHPMMSADEAADYLNIPRTSIMRAIRNGKLPGIKVGNNFRIKREDLDAMMSATS
jgi:excisionase family DNA binding protein